MAKLTIYPDIKFQKHRIAFRIKGERIILEGKGASLALEKFNADEICLYAFSLNSKTKAVGQEFMFNKKEAAAGTVFHVTWSEPSSVFDVNLSGQFEREIDETDLKMMLENEQELSDMGISIKGLSCGEFWKKGFISRIDRFDAESNDVFPKIRFDIVL